MIVETERLLLRPVEMGDVDDLALYHSDPETVRFIPWPVRTREQVREALEKAVAATNFENDGDFKLFAWVHKESRKVIGQSSIRIEARAHKRGELGWLINPSYAGRGFAFEAVRAVIDLAFTHLDFHRVTALMDVRNQKSASLAERLGMRREAEYREDELLKGEWISSYLYAILSEEWKAVNPVKIADIRQ